MKNYIKYKKHSIQYMKKIGILHGQETSFPEAIVARINAKGVPGIMAEPVQIDKVIQGAISEYAVIIDRISQDVNFYRAYLKNAALNGTAVINNPFWWSADEKFFNNCLAIQIGVPVPRTILLPSKQMPPDTTADSFRNLKYPMDWQGIVDYIGFPAYMKPHSGGGWKSVYRVDSLEDLFAKHAETDVLVMMLQEEIVFEEYYRCYCIGGKYVKIMPYEPRNEPHLRYVTDHRPTERMLKTLTDYVLRLNHALGYDFNTVEFAVRDGVPYAIDFCNPAPDADANSVGPENFEWVVETAATYAIERALAQTPGKDNLTWGTYIKQAAGFMSVAAPKKRGRKAKPKAETDATAPKRRGRPAKPKTEKAPGEVKRRGRPAKPKAETIAGEAKRRGRPAKPKTETVAGEAKRRGRPAKPKAETVAGEAKRRGRPAKPKAETVAGEAKRRGRPAKPKAEKAPGEIKRRGRPAKPKTEVDLLAEPKKRGRPAKAKTEGTKAEPKKRGRKPKSAITGKSKSAPKKGGRKSKTNKSVRQKRVKIEKPFGDLIGLEAVLAAEKMMGKDL
jgi:glutathione synthase/RimK-type ligase-like ATP-grasp enzyme